MGILFMIRYVEKYLKILVIFYKSFILFRFKSFWWRRKGGEEGGKEGEKEGGEERGDEGGRCIKLRINIKSKGLGEYKGFMFFWIL